MLDQRPLCESKKNLFRRFEKFKISPTTLTFLNGETIIKHTHTHTHLFLNSPMRITTKTSSKQNSRLIPSLSLLLLDELFESSNSYSLFCSRVNIEIIRKISSHKLQNESSRQMQNQNQGLKEYKGAPGYVLNEQLNCELDSLFQSDVHSTAKG